MARTRYSDLATYFERSGETQERFAARLGLTQGYVSRVRHGLMVPRPDRAQTIAEAADIPLDSFQRAYLARQSEVA